HVDDAIAAYLAIERCLETESVSGQAFNAGGGRPYSVRRLLELLGEAIGRPLDPEFRGEGSPAGEIDRQWVDPARLAARTGWAARVDLLHGLRRSYEWYADRPELLPGVGTGSSPLP